MKLIALSVAAVLLAGCSNMSKQDVGALTGTVAGVAIGSTIGGGKGRTAAMILGGVAGAMIGGAIGKDMDERDRERATRSLETTRTGQTTSWVNPDSGNSYQVTPTKTYTSQSGQPCREYTTTAIIGGKKQEVYGTACRQADGSWQAQ